MLTVFKILPFKNVPDKTPKFSPYEEAKVYPPKIGMMLDKVIYHFRASDTFSNPFYSAPLRIDGNFGEKHRRG